MKNQNKLSTLNSISDFVKKRIVYFLRKNGYVLSRTKNEFQYPVDFEPIHRQISTLVASRTMTSPERLFALIEAVRYISANKIPGAIVECGVWKGGSMMAVALTLLQINDTSRDLYLFDTFEGIPMPSEEDVSYRDQKAGEIYKKLQKERQKENPEWMFATLDDVKEALYSTRYPQDKIHFIKGYIEDTIPDKAPEIIALLRLDTDWYSSTLHELKWLYPRLSVGAPFIVDDYGHWKGARKAVDKYISETNLQVLLNRIDYTGRIGIKLR